MPITSPLPPSHTTQEEFAQLDYLVMRHAFESQNQLLQDWGCWLDVALYTEALVHFAGGETQVVQLLPLVRGQVSLGKQHFNLLNVETAFRVTALTTGAEEYERHLRSLLFLSPLRAIQWINLARNRVQLVSLVK